jgi:hypothetical protein
MQLTRCCFVFLVQGSLYLVSGRREGEGGAGVPRMGERAGSGRAQKLSPFPQASQGWRRRLELGERAGPRPETGHKGLIGAGRGLSGWPTHSAAGGWRCD